MVTTCIIRWNDTRWPCVISSNDTRSIVTRSSFDNDERHVTAVRPITEAAHSWSYNTIHMMHNSECDLQLWRTEVKNVAWGCSPSATFSTNVYHIWLSYDQLWAVLLIGWNAVKWCWALSYVHRLTVTWGDIIMLNVAQTTSVLSYDQPLAYNMIFSRFLTSINK